MVADSSQGLRTWGSGGVDLALQVSPEAEVTRVQVRRPGRPIQAPDGLPAQDPPQELSVQVPHVGVGDVTRRAVLLPPEIVKVAAVPLTELGQHSVLKKPMVPWPVHALVAENSQAEGTVPPHATKHHQLLLESWSLHRKVLRPAPFLPIARL